QDPSDSVPAAARRGRVTPSLVRRAILVDLERHVHARILHLLVALRDFVARQRRLTPRAIRQNLVTAIQESAIKKRLQRPPYTLDIVVRVRDVRMRIIEPERDAGAQTLPVAAIPKHAFAAEPIELGDAD